MDEKRFLDEDEEEPLEQEKSPKAAKKIPAIWLQYLNAAGSLVAVTAIILLTLEMGLGQIRLGKLAAYLMGSSFLIGIFFILIIAFRYALTKVEPGLWRYAFWFLSIPMAFLYYLVFLFLIYGQFAPFLVDMMELVFANAP